VCVSKGACDECGSSDANALYSDGHTHCFSCNTTKQGEGAPSAAPSGKRPRALVSGEVCALPARGITDETCRKWGYTVGYAKHPKTGEEQKCQIAAYRDDSGVVVAQKLRWKDKSFQFVGEPKLVSLYGRHLWRDGGKKIVITEGEIDALTVSQLQSNKWPVVSIANGASSAAKAIGQNLEWLLQFEEIVLMFDDDEPGRKAAEACAPMFPAGRCKVARIDGYKDANEALVAGHGGRVIDAIWSAKAFRPDGIVSVADVREKLKKRIVRGRDWPWPALTDATYGRRRGELYGIGAGTGVGKTTWFKQVQAHVLEVDKLPIGVFSLEEQTDHTVRTIAGVIDGIMYHVPDVDYDEEKFFKTVDALDGRLHLYDHFGAATFETIVEKIRYMAHAFGIKDFFIDHLTALAATLGDDERKAIDKIMAELSALTIELDCTIYFISHLSTPEGKPHEEGGRVLERHFRGSRSIGYWAHFLFAIEGNKQEPLVPRVFRVLKDRYTGRANGLTFGLHYQRDTGRMVEGPLPEEESPFNATSSTATGDF
jgi:twinkle protein